MNVAENKLLQSNKLAQTKRKKSIPANVDKNISESVMLKPSITEYIGGIDAVYRHKLMGWACHTGEKSAPLEVNVLIDGEPVARVKTGIVRVDQLGNDGSPLPCGFEIELSDKYFDGSIREIEINTCPGEMYIDGGKMIAKLEVKDYMPERSRVVEGHVDHVQGLFITGWALDPESPNNPVIVELISEDKCIANTEAKLFRSDLLDAKKGTGHCAFALRIPPGVFDGNRHDLMLREQRTGTILQGLRPTLPAIVVRGAVDGLDGSAVVGWASIQGFDGPIPVDLWIDGEFASKSIAETRVDGQSGRKFVLGIPDRYLDGRPHELIVSLTHNPGRYVAADVQILPAVLTPEDALQRYAGTRYLRSYISQLGPQRYESLRQGLGMLAHEAMKANSKEKLNQLAQAIISMSQGQEQVIRGFNSPVTEFVPINFAKLAEPDVSIVIPVHNKFATTYNCLASIAAAQCRATYEVIVVDDGSKDETLNLNVIAPNVKVVRHDVAQGFVGACNDGGLAAIGKYILMLNNDTEVMSGWLDALLDPFTRFEGVGMTGAKLIYPDGRLQEAGGLVWGDGQPWNIGRNANASDPRYNYVRQVDYLSGACVLLPMFLWRDLKGFDTHFAPAYYEDTDLAFRVRFKGFKTVYTPFCEVVHYEGVSNGTSTSGSGLKRFQAINEPKFKSRWAKSYRHNGVVGRDAPHVMQDRGTQFRVLVLDAQTLTPDLDAGSYSATQEIRILQSLGFKVTFVPANMAYMAGYTESLQRMGVEVLYAPFYYSMAEVVERRGSEFDLFYIARYGVAEQVIDLIRSRHPQARVILNIHDLHFLRELREALQNKSPELMQQAIHTRDAELAVLRKVNLALSYSEVEQAVIVSHNLNSTKTADCPWVVETVESIPAFEDREGIAFLGGFGHRPNVEAVEWFVREVMPILRQKMPGVPLLIYGSKAPDTFKALLAEDVVLKGFVKSTDDVYDKSRVFVAPLLTGAGLKGKVIGAFARGIPTVMTPTAAEGTGASHGQAAMICSTAEEWAAKIFELYTNEKAWNSMSESCRTLAKQKYSFEYGRTKIASALNQLGLFPDNAGQSLWPLSAE